MTGSVLKQPLYNRVAIIGGGPAGLAAAKALALEPTQFAKIDIYERRNKLGGLWYHNGNKSLVHPEVPSVDPDSGELLDKPATDQDAFFSAIYKYMETNIIGRLMEYQGLPFPRESPMYPKRDKVLEYIDEYIKTIPEGKIEFKLNFDVVSVKKVDANQDGYSGTDSINNSCSSEGTIWRVVADNVSYDSREVHEYDAIIIANGHFNTPYIPEVSGLSEWNEALPHTILHSKHFEDPNTYRGKRVLVIGNASSGVDISTQISTVAEKVYVSVRDVGKVDPRNDLIEYIGLIIKYDYTTRSITTINGDHFEGIDVVIFCTGYFYSVPFLKLDVITDGTQVHDLYKQVFNVYDPSISFLALQKEVVPMPISESQAALVARVYSGRYNLPSVEERKQSYEKEIQMKGSGRQFHSFAYPLDVAYRQHLQQLIDEQDIRSPGLVAPIWDESLIFDRSQTKSYKAKRLQKVFEHVKKLRSEGRDFELLD
ncbi:monooxygenase [Lodderomyces elongisporus]|uniref:monooxygenase n=1 Tax=Lodderomyces elongisporus TaxID=36914 RepID=UPI00291FA70B|nr:monooxygenase [Lodderomyces elongisporus]WLF77649.1 monooxygenase [Lodderomyces elongisporus]